MKCQLSLDNVRAGTKSDFSAIIIFLLRTWPRLLVRRKKALIGQMGDTTKLSIC